MQLTLIFTTLVTFAAIAASHPTPKLVKTRTSLAKGQGLSDLIDLHFTGLRMPDTPDSVDFGDTLVSPRRSLNSDASVEADHNDDIDNDNDVHKRSSRDSKSSVSHSTNERDNGDNNNGDDNDNGNYGGTNNNGDDNGDNDNGDNNDNGNYGGTNNNDNNNGDNNGDNNNGDNNNDDNNDNGNNYGGINQNGAEEIEVIDNDVHKRDSRDPKSSVSHSTNERDGDGGGDKGRETGGDDDRRRKDLGSYRVYERKAFVYRLEDEKPYN